MGAGEDAVRWVSRTSIVFVGRDWTASGGQVDQLLHFWGKEGR